MLHSTNGHDRGMLSWAPPGFSALGVEYRGAAGAERGGV